MGIQYTWHLLVFVLQPDIIRTACVTVCCSLYCYSLLDLLADRKDKSGKTGKVLINGQRRQPNYKNLVGYVVQVR